MLRVKAGDLDKMGLLFKRFRGPLYGFLFQMTNRREASEDMVQTVFYRMLKYRHTFTGNGELVSWMYHLARNVLKDEGRKLKQQEPAADLSAVKEHPADGKNAGEQMEQKQLAEKLYRAIQQLSDDHREVVVLHRLQELKHREIAQILEIREDAVRARLYRAMLELKSVYKRLND